MAQDNQWTLTISQNAILAALSINHEAQVEISQVLDAMTKAGICYGIRESAIQQALARRNGPGESDLRQGSRLRRLVRSPLSR
ncbi:MAG: hypothetical protein AAGT88_02335 [Dethiobacter sp.]